MSAPAASEPRSRCISRAAGQCRCVVHAAVRMRVDGCAVALERCVSRPKASCLTRDRREAATGRQEATLGCRSMATIGQLCCVRAGEVFNE